MKIQTTKDGSHTLVSKEFGELYHSHNGSFQEAMHIFIHNGLKEISKEKISVFEMGFGSGLNAILSLYFAQENNISIEYETIEAYPISTDIATKLNYNNYIQKNDYDMFFSKLHQADWNKRIEISESFAFKKLKNKIEDIDLKTLNKADIIFYDAFAPSSQANLWEEEVLLKMYNLLNPNGFLITYCAKGAFKRTLKKIGFKLEALPGPIGKREITRAWK